MRKLAAGFIVGLVAAAVVLAADSWSAIVSGGVGLTLLEALELKTYDWRLSRTARPDTARTDIALVAIDESSLRNLEPNAGRWPWPRVVHSSLIDYLKRAPAKVVVYDVNFAGPDTRVGFRYGESTWSGAESDRALADSVKAAGNVVLLTDASFDGDARDVPVPADAGFTIAEGAVDLRVVFPPFPALAGAGSIFGHNRFVLDADGPIRHTLPFVRSRGVVVPSLGLAAALRMMDSRPADVTSVDETLRIADRRMPLSWRHDRTANERLSVLWGLINFRGPATFEDLERHTYSTYSFFDLLYSEEQLLAGLKPNIDPFVFRGKLVFVGATASGLSDVFETPFARGKMAGIQLHASAADDILSNRFMHPASRAATLAAVVAGGIVIGLLATAVPPWWATALTLAMVALFAWSATRLFAAGYWMNLSQPVLSGSFALFGGVAYQYLVEGREKRKMKKLFGQYVSKDVYAQLVSNPALARLGGQRREMTVLFSDIRGFTTVSERGQPEEIVALLNEYFTRMVDIVFRHKGTLDKFVGDMVMALFGAPLDDPDHADHAVEAALEMIEALGQLNADWTAQGRPALDIGIGINTGPMIAGNIGSEAIMSYTVIGDAVNLGSRLESLNKQYGTRIIISDSTRARLARLYRFRPLGDVVVKGKSQAVAIFEVVGRAESAAEVQTT